MTLVRYLRNPILKPTANWWEEKGVFNPGATIFKDKIYLLYRAWGADNLSRFGLAVSSDGYKFKRNKDPILEGMGVDQYERLGIEDPRISRIGETYYVVYTAASVYGIESAERNKWAKSLNHPYVPYRVRVSLATTTDFETFHHHGVLIDSFDTKDATLLPEKHKGYYFLYHRHVPSIWLSFSHNLTHWQKGREIVRPKENWERQRIGIGSQPIWTEKGWLFFYHGVDMSKTYRLGALLIDLDNPSQVIARTKKPIFEPLQAYEKDGNVSQVVFTCGAVEKDDDYLVYYGAADKSIGVAKIAKNDLFSLLLDRID